MLFPRKDPKDFYTLTRSEDTNPLSSFAAYPFELDGEQWPTVEHYYHAKKFTDETYAAKVRGVQSPAQAAKMGKSWFHGKRKDWKKIRVTMMTRATYIQCRTHADVAKALLDTGDKEILDVSQYDYFWGAGRDMRGENAYGKMLMDVRKKLKEEAQSNHE